jgi:hypothetical protein
MLFSIILKFLVKIFGQNFTSMATFWAACLPALASEQSRAAMI